MDISVKSKLNTSPVFSGKVIIKGKKNMPKDILLTLEKLGENGFLKEFSENRDIIVRLKRKKPNSFDTAHENDLEIFNLSFSAVKENSWISRLIDPFNFRAHKTLAHNYHHEKNIIKRLYDNQYVLKLKNKLFKK